MSDESKVEIEVKKLREEVSEMRNVVNLLIGLIMEEDEAEVEIRAPESSRMYN